MSTDLATERRLRDNRVTKRARDAEDDDRAQWDMLRGIYCGYCELSTRLCPDCENEFQAWREAPQ